MGPEALTTTSIETVCRDVGEKGEASAGASEPASHLKEKQPALSPTPQLNVAEE